MLAEAGSCDIAYFLRLLELKSGCKQAASAEN
jgi:hypothetical protein